MTKEDKQIIDRAVKEEWRIGDRSHLKRLLKKNLKLYRENVELEKRCEETQELLDKQIEATYKLDKENAELKERVKMLEQGYVWHDYDAGEDCYEDSHEGKWVKRDEVYQLTKAKELIKEFVQHYKNKTIYVENMQDLLEQTEQFIKEIEE